MTAKARVSIQPVCDPVLTGSELLTLGRDEDPTSGPTYSTAQLTITRYGDGGYAFTAVNGDEVYVQGGHRGFDLLFLALANLT